MPISKQRKVDIVAQYMDALKDCSGVVITEYRGLNMPLFDRIRSEMRNVGAQYTVAKNTLLKIALKESGLAVPEDLLVGPVAVGFAGKDFPGAIKTLLSVAKDAELLILKGAISAQSIYQEGDLKTLSELPTLDELRATLAGMVVQPMSQLVSLMVAPQRDVISVIANYVKKQEEENGEGGGDEQVA